MTGSKQGILILLAGHYVIGHRLLCHSLVLWGCNAAFIEAKIAADSHWLQLKMPKF